MASPACVLDRTSPSLMEPPQCRPASPRADRAPPPQPRIAERVRLRRVDPHVTGSDIAALGVINVTSVITCLKGLEKLLSCIHEALLWCSYGSLGVARLMRSPREWTALLRLMKSRNVTSNDVIFTFLKLMSYFLSFKIEDKSISRTILCR